MNTTIPNNRGSPLDLRPYQKTALDRMRSYEGDKALVVLGTGLGKTVIFTEYIKEQVLQYDHRVLILSHREELVKQPLEYLKGIPCGIELGSLHSHGEKVVSASVQSLVRRLPQFNHREFDTIIVDEGHHCAAPTYRKILDYFDGATVFGFTATAHRGDGVGLGCVFDDILMEYNTLNGIEDGFLCPIEAHQVNLKYDMGSVKYEESTGDFNAADVARIMSGTAAGVVEAYGKFARGATIIFAASLDEGRDITDLLNKQYGKGTAAFISGSTRNRGRVLEAYKLGLTKVIVNFGVLTEGTDLPITETVIIARPIALTNVGLYAQMVGRGLRLYPGKTSCVLIDCVGISNAPICTAATLIGKDVPKPEPKKDPAPKTTEEDKPLEVLKGDKVPESWISKESKVDVMENGIGNDMHGVAWIALKDGGFILPIPNMIYRISKPLPNGCVYVRRNKSCSKSAVPLQFAFDYIYQDLKQKHGKARHIWDKTMRGKWDGQPISQQQIQLIHKLAPDYTIDTAKMTRGDASGIIQLLLYKPEEWNPDKEADQHAPETP